MEFANETTLIYHFPMTNTLKLLRFTFLFFFLLRSENIFAQFSEVVPGQYIVKFKRSLTANPLTVSKFGQVLEMLPGHNATLIDRGQVQTKESVLAEISSDQDVEWVEPNVVYQISKTPNDPEWPQLWGLHSTDGFSIEADKAWEISTGSSNTTVAVIDTGVDYNSPEFNGNIWINKAEFNGLAGIDDDGNGFIDDINGWDFVSNLNSPTDDHGHGTHVSGTIGARGNDNYGIVGVAWNVRILPIKAMKADGTGDLVSAAKAVDYAVLMGAKVINASWASAIPSNLLVESIQRARDKGVLFVACAGNTSKDNDSRPMFPASYDIENIISVAAIDRNGALAPFSSYGAKTVHVAAPGVDILSITPKGYQQMSGTSMAAPHVTGIAVLLLGAEPDLSFSDLKKRILQTARPLPSLRGRMRTGGLANAYRALAKIIAPFDPEDPEGWLQKINLNISTPHPYLENQNLEYVVEIPGAKKISLYFKKFDTEKKYDKVSFVDRQGKVLDTMDGINSESWTSNFSGDYVRVIFVSDKTNNDYGFDLTKAAYQ